MLTLWWHRFDAPESQNPNNSDRKRQTNIWYRYDNGQSHIIMNMKNALPSLRETVEWTFQNFVLTMDRTLSAFVPPPDQRHLLHSQNQQLKERLSLRCCRKSITCSGWVEGACSASYTPLLSLLDSLAVLDGCQTVMTTVRCSKVTNPKTLTEKDNGSTYEIYWKDNLIDWNCDSIAAVESPSFPSWI